MIELKGQTILQDLQDRAASRDATKIPPLEEVIKETQSKIKASFDTNSPRKKATQK